MKDLTLLPGVGRKTANVILWNIFGKNIGFVVDTHIKRIANRTGLSTENNPNKIEQDLMKHFPQNYWGKIAPMFIQFGRDICQSKKPKCKKCFLRKNCPNFPKYKNNFD